MGAYSQTIYTFIADTCILVVIGYLLVRGRMLALLSRPRTTLPEAMLLGLLLGLVGLLEALLPDTRFFYATHTLFVTFAAIVGGMYVGLITAAVVSMGAMVSQTREFVVGTVLAAFIGAVLGHVVRHIAGIRERLIGGFAIGALVQSCRLLLHFVIAGKAHMQLATEEALVSILANGLGVVLLLLIVHDAQVRAESERRRIEAERAQALVSQAQLAAVRARIHPHFLFNTLTSIAALCSMAPERAEAAILRLSRLMRRALEASSATSVYLEEEIESVQAYLQIEQERLGSRLLVQWRLDPGYERIPVPPFALQTLVENAVQHGIAPKLGPGTVTITVRCSSRHTVVAVRDDGVGMDETLRRRVLIPENSRMHGLRILHEQLILLYGRRARLRLFSHENAGTLIAFVLPTSGAGQREKEAGNDNRTYRG